MPSLNFNYIYSIIYKWIVMWWSFSPLTIVILKIIWASIGIGCLIFIIVIFRKRQALLKAEAVELEQAMRQEASKTEKRNGQWEKIITYVNSDNPSDWKLAIIEADTLLDSLVQKMGYKGDNLGERLKTIEPSDFLTLDAAWEAHKVRNAIAHESGYELSEREAKRVVKLFESVFKEFEYI